MRFKSSLVMQSAPGDEQDDEQKRCPYGLFSPTALVIFKRPVGVKEEQKVTVPLEKSTKPAFVLLVQLGDLCWVVKDF